MEDINIIIGKNLLKLRKTAKLTQMELAEKFNYSDKSISKWENGESLPSIEVLYELAKFYNTSLDALVNDNIEPLLENKTKENKEKQHKPKAFPTKLVVTLLAVVAVWLTATLTFVCLMLINNIIYPIIFLWAIPVSCIVLIVFNSIWGRYRYLFIILSVLLWTGLAGLQIQLLLVGINIWPVYFIGIPLQVAIILWGALVKKPKSYYKKLKEEKLKAKQELENEQEKEEQK